uniref:Uncharacterized protein n=1 Tax=Plectus sambesii TaxID=2011161 RepID=A0A914VPW1_9BILA
MRLKDTNPAGVGVRVVVTATGDPTTGTSSEGKTIDWRLGWRFTGTTPEFDERSSTTIGCRETEGAEAVADYSPSARRHFRSGQGPGGCWRWLAADDCH